MEFPGTYAHPRGTTLRIKTGIVGIRKYLADNAGGWHIFTDGSYSEFSYEKLSEIRKTYGAYILTGVMGNVLSFECKYDEIESGCKP
jgi:hypothetical protein